MFIYLFILTIAATKIIYLKENQCNLCIEASQALHSVTKDKERRAKKDRNGVATGKMQKCHERQEHGLRGGRQGKGAGVPLPKQHSILCPVLKDVTYFSSLCWLF